MQKQTKNIATYYLRRIKSSCYLTLGWFLKWIESKLSYWVRGYYLLRQIDIDY